MKYYDTYKLIKSEDLNHHGTLFAGRMSEWFVESCFISVSNEYRHPENLVCLRINELKFMSPIRKGDIINIKSKIVSVGNTSIIAYGKVMRNDSDDILVEGFLTFVCVDSDGKKMKHNIILDEAKNKEDEDLILKVKTLK